MSERPWSDERDAFDVTSRAERQASTAALSGADTLPAAPTGRDTVPTTPAALGLGGGMLVGRYRIEQQLGAGGMGIVYRARDTELDRSVALKLVRPHGNVDELTERLRRESRLQARAAHASVITVYDVGRDGDQVFVAMELIEGVTLTRWLHEGGRRWREILDVFCRAGEGLGAAHAAGLVHRDFKPDNVLVELRADRVARVLVSDFGVARAVEDADAPAMRVSALAIGVTAPGAIVGTPAYMSPEQLAAVPTDARADVFSFCVALWEALFGERPFGGGSLAEIVTAFGSDPVEPARHAVPRWLVRVLRRGLAAEREARTPSMAVLLGELDWRRRRRQRLGGAIAGVIVVGAAAAFVVVRLLAPAPPVSACTLTSDVGERVQAAGETLATALGERSPLLATHWREATQTYARQFGELRALACAAWSEEQVRCIDQRGARDVAVLEAARDARSANGERRAALLRGSGRCSRRTSACPRRQPSSPRIRRASLRCSRRTSRS